MPINIGVEMPYQHSNFDDRQVTLADYLRFDDPSLKVLYLRNLHVCSWFPDELDTMHCPEVRRLGRTDRGGTFVGLVSPSPRLPVSPSPRLPVSPSPSLPVSLALCHCSEHGGV